ncbi:MAG: SIMPL domain-containing protein [Patescibacteria group bacterium]|nr:SIMPL domain-containing protein [Patescibacteria group bacterium]
MENSKKTLDLSSRLYVLAIVLVAGAFIFWGTQALTGLMGWIVGYGPREVNITAEGKATASPDVALISLGVKTEGQKVATIVTENNSKMNSIIAGVEDLGVEAKDIQTTNYSLTPRYDYLENQGQVFRGYTLSQQIKVKVRDFSKIGDVLEKSTAEGANIVGDLQFTIDDLTKIKEQAMANAIAKAKAKAAAISTASGLKLKKLVNVYESNGVYPQVYDSAAGIGYAESAKVMPTAPAPRIQSGEQEVTVDITLTYRVR